VEDINYFTLALASFIFAITPGPGVVAVLATSVSRGIPSGLVMTAGEVTADMVYLLVAMVSLAGLSHALSDVLAAVRILGGLYLCWLGIQTFRSPPIRQAQAPASARGLGLAYGTGFMVSITNPKVVVFYLSFLPLFIDLSALNVPGGAKVMAVMFVSVYLGPALVAVLAGRAGHLVTGERSGRIMNAVTGFLLIGVGTALVLTAWI
jgi:threonine/homoserine/homoserine lactone efflux protein